MIDKAIHKIKKTKPQTVSLVCHYSQMSSAFSSLAVTNNFCTVQVKCSKKKRKKNPAIIKTTSK